MSAALQEGEVCGSTRRRIRAARAQSSHSLSRRATRGAARAVPALGEPLPSLHRMRATPCRRTIRVFRFISARAKAPTQQPCRRTVCAERVAHLLCPPASSAICRSELLTAGHIPATPTQALRGHAGGKPPGPPPRSARTSLGTHLARHDTSLGTHLARNDTSTRTTLVPHVLLHSPRAAGVRDGRGPPRRSASYLAESQACS